MTSLYDRAREPQRRPLIGKGRGQINEARDAIAAWELSPDGRLDDHRIKKRQR